MGIAKGRSMLWSLPEEAKFSRAYLQNYSELAQTAWQALYPHVMLHLYQKSANLKMLFFWWFDMELPHGRSYTTSRRINKPVKMWEQIWWQCISFIKRYNLWKNTTNGRYLSRNFKSSGWGQCYGQKNSVNKIVPFLKNKSINDQLLQQILLHWFAAVKYSLKITSKLCVLVTDLIIVSSIPPFLLF